MFLELEYTFFCPSYIPISLNFFHTHVHFTCKYLANISRNFSVPESFDISKQNILLLYFRTWNLIRKVCKQKQHRKS